jgi:glyoxylase-like metal-dependent hydrolase (beta-lactamase superfamily II)
VLAHADHCTVAHEPSAAPEAREAGALYGQEAVSRSIDLMHLGRDRVICAYEVDGVVVDPGPATCVEALLAGLGGAPPRALLVTHIHLDHAGATGVLLRRFPEIRVYVHSRGAPHLADPSKLLASARQLYGDEMERLWGEVAPVPAESITELQGGEAIEGFRVAYAPGHASHHVVYLHESSGDAYAGDVAGVTIPPATFALAPTPPPDIDLEAWDRSLDLLEEWAPAALCLTHFGRIEAVAERVLRMREALARSGERARMHGRDAFLAATRAEVREACGDEALADRFFRAAPPEQLWLGLERYWRKRAERAGAEPAEAR